MTIHHRKESTATLETLMSETRFENLIAVPTPLGKVSVPLRDDGLSLVLSAVVCLFGS